ncbi:MMPL family transporter [Nocardia macrotermitis]|uniref:Trehalose monomycolate exporter MmpL3 n=1 Tax=Nocardia macrotermitis TaxID=2585198 RepID=A0A7K0CW17_9NOCA|nr:MMPL family transporter [Nocardia macrotermitis]MQY17172.1 Trehalose monomycolate exporter MmpL3 [Nocardia macrotermitis]
MFTDFTRWADMVVRRRFTVIVVLFAALLALGVYGMDLHSRLSADGWDDPGSQSIREARIKSEAFGRNHIADVLVLYHAPAGRTIDDPAFARTIVRDLNALPQRFPEQIAKINGTYWRTDTGVSLPDVFGTKDRRYAFASIAIRGDDNTTVMRNYRKVAGEFTIPGIDMRVAGGQPVAGALNDTMAHDQLRMELFAIPAVAILLFFVFGGVVAAALPLIAGGLTVVGAWGVIRAITTVTDVNSFVSPVVSMIGLGLAIDYGLFIVSRFREELADGHEVPVAVRRTMGSAGRTVVSSATIVVAASAAILLFPQGFLRSFAYGAMITVALAAFTAVTLLPALLAVLGRRIDLFGFRRFQRTRGTSEDPDNRWGRLAGWVMKRPLAVGIPIVAILVLLIAPIRDIAFGGITERFLPPDNPTRVAQQHFDRIFPLRQTGPISLILITNDSAAVPHVFENADRAPGLAAPFPNPVQASSTLGVFTTDTVLLDPHRPDPTIDYLRSMPLPRGTTLLVGGTPAEQRDSVDALLHRLPWMIALVFALTTALMFTAFGSIVLPLQAAALNLLGLGSTLGILTWVFIDGHGSRAMNFTPQPIMALVLVLIVSVIYGLSTDYQIFLLARIVEARRAGASTVEAVRSGIAHTGRIITAAALILLVVTGAFALSELVMMQYIAFGMVAALFIDAAVLRMLLVPATMRLFGDLSWWSPRRRRRPPATAPAEPETATTPEVAHSAAL